MCVCRGCWGRSRRTEGVVGGRSGEDQHGRAQHGAVLSFRTTHARQDEQCLLGLVKEFGLKFQTPFSGEVEGTFVDARAREGGVRPDARYVGDTYRVPKRGGLLRSGVEKREPR